MRKKHFCMFTLFSLGLSLLSAQAPEVKTTTQDTIKIIKAKKPTVITAKSATTAQSVVKVTPSVKTKSKAKMGAKSKTKSKMANKTSVKTVPPVSQVAVTKAGTGASKAKTVPTAYSTVKKPPVQVTGKGGDLTPRSDAMLISLNNQMLSEINALRKTGTTCGGERMPPVKALAWNTQLEKAALVHAEDMDKYDHFSHEGIDGSKPEDRITATGYAWQKVGVNIGQSYKDVPTAVKAWKESKDHCKQMMSADVTEIGGAKKGKYWCLNFAKPID